MKALVVMTALGLGLLIPSARGADLSIKGNLNEVLSASDNYFLTNQPKGVTAETLTAGTLDVLARTPTTDILLDSYYSYYKYFGPGAADTNPTWGTPAHASLNVNHVEQLATYNAAASWTRSDTAVTSLAQTGVSSGHGSINTFSANGGVAYDLSRIDLVSLNSQVSRTNYTDPAQFPFRDFATTAAWKHTLSSTTLFDNFAVFDWFSEDDPAQSQRLLWRFMTGVVSTLSPRLNFTGHVGWVFANSYQTGSGPSTPSSSGSCITGLGITICPSGPFGTVPFVPQGGAGNSWVADAALTYRLTQTTTASLTAAQAVVPLFNGALQKSDTAGLTFDHAINHLSNVAFSAQFSHIPATSGNSIFGGQASASDFFSAGVNYNYRLTREWSTNMSYTYRQRNDSTGIARSSTILVGLSYDFTLLGNPTAINIAQREKARERAQQSVGYVFPTFH